MDGESLEPIKLASDMIHGSYYVWFTSEKNPTEVCEAAAERRWWALRRSKDVPIRRAVPGPSCNRIDFERK